MAWLPTGLTAIIVYDHGSVKPTGVRAGAGRRGHLPAPAGLECESPANPSAPECTRPGLCSAVERRRSPAADERPMGARPGVRCNGMLACLHDRVAKAVARCFAQVRMYQPSTKHPLTLHTHSFEEPRRRLVFHITGCPHPVDRWLRQGPLDHGRHRFTHEALMPPASRKRITQIHCTCAHADFDQSHERPILLEPETPRKGGPLDPGAFASAQEVLRLGDIAMWRPGHVLGDSWIASVIVKHDLRIRNSGRFGHEPRGLPRAFRWCHLRVHVGLTVE